MRRTLSLLMLAATLALPAQAQTLVTLKSDITDADGNITIGDLFDNAGQAASVTVGRRAGPTAVLDAGQVQAIARRAGVYWDNPQGLRRIIVNAGQAQTQRTTEISRSVAIRRSEQVRVTWTAGSLSLSMTGIAQKDAAVGDVLSIQNPQSKKLIEAVVTGPGTAVAGSEAARLRNASLYSAR